MTRVSNALAELMALYPKGCAAPKGYVYWHDWAKAQTAHGLNSQRCQWCGLWLFPQDEHHPKCTGPRQGTGDV